MASTFTPAGAPPPGVTPNFENPQDTLYPGMVMTTSLIIAITTAFTAARLVARKSVASYAFDDYLLIFAWALNVAYNALLIWQAQAGIGRHVWDVLATDAIKIAKQSWALELVYCPLTASAKVALLLQLQRTFAPTKSGAVYVMTQVLLWVNVAFYFAIFWAVLFECIPQARIWDPRITTGYCVSRNAEMAAAGLFNVVADFCIFVLPLWAIWHLHTAVKNKLGISAIFLTGLIAVISSLGRVVYTFRAFTSTDPTYVIAQISLWTLAENASVILCTCFPVMPRFFKVVRSYTKRTITGSSHSTSKERSKYGYGMYNNITRNNRTMTVFPAAAAASVARCPDCHDELPCMSHRNLSSGESASSWQDTEVGVALSENVNTNNKSHHHDLARTGGIQKTVSIELTSQRTHARDLV